MKIFSFSVIKKAISYKGGSLLLLSIPLSITFDKIVEIIIKDVKLHDIVLPVFVLISGFALYTLFFIVDFCHGLMASKQEHVVKIKEGKAEKGSDWVKSSKLYSSFGKIGGVMLINIMMMFISLVLVVNQHSTLSVISMMFGSMFNILGALFEFHSIGENIKRRTSKKPDYYLFFDKITTILESIVFTRLKSAFLKNRTNDFRNDFSTENTIQYQKKEPLNEQ